MLNRRPGAGAYPESQANVVPLYELDQRHGFSKNNPKVSPLPCPARRRRRGGARYDRRRWRASADMGVGYPMVSVRDIESGKVRPQGRCSALTKPLRPVTRNNCEPALRLLLKATHHSLRKKKSLRLQIGS